MSTLLRTTDGREIVSPVYCGVEADRLTWYVPSTLREILAAGVTVEGAFGCDEAEHAELLDAPNTIRLAVEIEWTDELDQPDDEGDDPSWHWEPNIIARAEVFQARLPALAQGYGPTWENVRSEYTYQGDSSLARTRARDLQHQLTLNDMAVRKLIEQIAPLLAAEISRRATPYRTE